MTQPSTSQPPPAPWRCPSCRRLYALRAGRLPPDLCPECRRLAAAAQDRAAADQARLKAALDPPVPLEIPEQLEISLIQSAPARPEARREVARPILIGACLLVWACGAFAAPPADLTGYAGLAAAVWMLCSYIHWPIGRRFRWVAACLAIVSFGWCDSYDERKEWHDASGDYEIIWTYRRWSGQPKKAIWLRFGGLRSLEEMQGPMAGESRHGLWTQRLANGNEIRRWYWYGDEVTEGAWHFLDR